MNDDRKGPLRLRPELVDHIVLRLKALADGSRLKLLMRLQQGPANVNVLTDELQLSQATVSKHLAVLKRVGLVDMRRKGTQSVYSVHDEVIFHDLENVFAGVIRHLEEQHRALGETTEDIPSA